jgi:hypothetical protein
MITEKKQTQWILVPSVNAINVSEITSTFDGNLEINKTSHNYFINQDNYQDIIDSITDDELKNKIIEIYK